LRPLVCCARGQLPPPSAPLFTPLENPTYRRSAVESTHQQRSRRCSAHNMRAKKLHLRSVTVAAVGIYSTAGRRDGGIAARLSSFRNSAAAVITLSSLDRCSEFASRRVTTAPQTPQCGSGEGLRGPFAAEKKNRSTGP